MRGENILNYFINLHDETRAVDVCTDACYPCPFQTLKTEVTSESVLYDKVWKKGKNTKHQNKETTRFSVENKIAWRFQYSLQVDFSFEKYLEVCKG